MIKGMSSDIEEKVKTLLASADEEAHRLGMEICRTQHPALWASLMSFTGYGKITIEAISVIHRHSGLSIGMPVRYRGMDGSPNMVVTNIKFTTSNIGGREMYYTYLVCKYFQRSSQVFSTVEDRVECFEKIDRLREEKKEDSK